MHVGGHLSVKCVCCMVILYLCPVIVSLSHVCSVYCSTVIRRMSTVKAESCVSLSSILCTHDKQRYPSLFCHRHPLLHCLPQLSTTDRVLIICWIRRISTRIHRRWMVFLFLLSCWRATVELYQVWLLYTREYGVCLERIVTANVTSGCGEKRCYRRRSFRNIPTYTPIYDSVYVRIWVCV